MNTIGEFTLIFLLVPGPKLTAGNYISHAMRQRWDVPVSGPRVNGVHNAKADLAMVACIQRVVGQHADCRVLLWSPIPNDLVFL